jgi:prophage regulatory protein
MDDRVAMLVGRETPPDGVKISIDKENAMSTKSTVSTSSHTLWRLPRVEAETGLCRSAVYAHVGQGLLPKPVRISARSIAWPASEIDFLNRARVAGWADSELRDLVATLEAERLTAMDGRTAASQPSNRA